MRRPRRAVKLLFPQHSVGDVSVQPIHVERAAGKLGTDPMGTPETDVTFVDTSARDGAAIAGFSTSNKISLIDLLVKAGLRHIDCVAFTHPRLIPKYADAEKVMAEIQKKHKVTYIGLVPNEIGCRRAITTGIDQVLTLVAASDTYNRLAVGRSRNQTLNKILPAILEVASNSGKPVRSYILTAFGCPYTGKVSFEEVVRIILKLDYMGVHEISLVDSAGMANPKSVKELIRIVLELKSNIVLAVHFHNNRGMAMANCIAAYESGVRIFDTSLGGLSGTPFGSIDQDIGNWNLPTEDLVQVFEEMGIKTGINLERLLEAVEFAEKISGKPLPGHALRATPRGSKLFPAPEKSVNIAS
jgi:hydroxymethylglutaryl-CoA lyase